MKQRDLLIQENTPQRFPQCSSRSLISCNQKKVDKRINLLEPVSKIIDQIDDWLERLRGKIQERIREVYGGTISVKDYFLNFRVYGKNGTMGPLEQAMKPTFRNSKIAIPYRSKHLTASSLLSKIFRLHSGQRNSTASGSKLCSFSRTSPVSSRYMTETTQPPGPRKKRLAGGDRDRRDKYGVLGIIDTEEVILYTPLEQSMS